jgi:hypothetical protein
MNTTEIKLRDSNKKRFTLDDVHAIVIGTEPSGRAAFPMEWEELLPRLVMVNETPAAYAFPEDV